MERFEGVPVAGGIAIGRIRFQKSHNNTPYREEIGDVPEEIARFEAARDAAVRELDALARRAKERVGEADAAVFTAQKMLVADPMLYDHVCDTIRERKVNAAYAVTEAQAYFTRMLLDTEEEYVRERAADVADVTERLLRLLAKAESGPAGTEHPEAAERGSAGTGYPGAAEGGSAGAGYSEEMENGPANPVILAAEELLPSETMRFEREQLLAFVVRRGSAISHTAILARTMGLPMLTGVEVREEWDGRIAVVDGNTGEIILDPDEACLKETREKVREVKAQDDTGPNARCADSDAARADQKGLERQVGGGRQIHLYANIVGASDLDAVRSCGAEGIGLFRSEFLFLGASDWPTEEEQFAAYRAVAEAMDKKPVIIRTLDAGADKQAPYMNLHEERGIRVCLERPEMFRAQLRAILRAAVYGTVSVMFPMVTSPEEVRACKAQLELAREEALSHPLRPESTGGLTLPEERTSCGSVAVGVMIETPGAVAHSAELAREVDFFSIGTNDLQQYLLGIDRQDAKAVAKDNVREQDGDADGPLPPVLAQALAATIENAHAAGIPVGICGEIAADPSLTGTLAQMGVDSLSVAPEALPRVREAL